MTFSLALPSWLLKFPSTLGNGEGSPKATRRERIMPSFLGGKSSGAFGQPAFFLAGNLMTIVTFEITEFDSQRETF